MKNASNKVNENYLLDEKQAAAFLTVSAGTLAVWRSTGRYALPFVKIGSKVAYRFVDLKEWVDKRVMGHWEK